MIKNWDCKVHSCHRYNQEFGSIFGNFRPLVPISHKMISFNNWKTSNSDLIFMLQRLVKLWWCWNNRLLFISYHTTILGHYYIIYVYKYIKASWLSCVAKKSLFFFSSFYCGFGIRGDTTLWNVWMSHTKRNWHQDIIYYLDYSKCFANELILQMLTQKLLKKENDNENKLQC